MVTSSVLVVLSFLHIATYVSITIGLPFEDSGRIGGRNEAFYDEVRQLLSLNHDTHQQSSQASSKESVSDGQSSENASVEDPMDKPDVPRAVKHWPQEALHLGQVAGVSVNSALQPVIFHRGDREWDINTFNTTHHYQLLHLGPIKEHTVLTLDPQTGKILGKWGADVFYMPHGLTVDRHDNLWVTDVALHQAFKTPLDFDLWGHGKYSTPVDSDGDLLEQILTDMTDKRENDATSVLTIVEFKPGELQPVLRFGVRFEPGSDNKHLCKPTHVAVATTGEIFIADGYCNNRILKYNAAGSLLRVIPSPPEFLSLQVPHALALIEPMDRLCVADRENKRVTCPRAGLYSIQGVKEPALTIQQPDMGRVFGVAAKGKLVYAVNGPTSPLLPVQGLTIDPQSESVIDHWAPEEGFGNPHAIAICPNGSALYVVEIGPNKVWKFELVPPKKK